MHSLSENGWGFRVIGSMGSPPDFHTILAFIKVTNMEEQNCTSRVKSLAVRSCRLSTFFFPQKKILWIFLSNGYFTFFHVPVISVNNFLYAYFICSMVFLHVPVLYVKKLNNSCAYFICSPFSFFSVCLFMCLTFCPCASLICLGFFMCQFDSFQATWRVATSRGRRESVVLTVCQGRRVSLVFLDFLDPKVLLCGFSCLYEFAVC